MVPYGTNSQPCELTKNCHLPNTGFQIWLKCGAGEQRSGSTGRNWQANFIEEAMICKDLGVKGVIDHLIFIDTLLNICDICGWLDVCVSCDFLFGFSNFKGWVDLTFGSANSCVWVCMRRLSWYTLTRWRQRKKKEFRCEQLGLDLGREGLPYYGVLCA